MVVVGVGGGQKWLVEFGCGALIGESLGLETEVYETLGLGLIFFEY